MTLLLLSFCFVFKPRCLLLKCTAPCIPVVPLRKSGKLGIFYKRPEKPDCQITVNLLKTCTFF